MKTGIIFDIKEFAIYDGPGIRQTVFLKGCPLKCNWCHNPEGISKKIQVIASNCQCRYCKHEQKVWLSNACEECGNTLPAIPKTVGEVITSSELVAKINSNSMYYKRYGGGVTFSGGEPLAQYDFLLETLRQLPGIHKAIETSGYCRSDHFKNIIRNVDLVMMDIKIVDDLEHKKHTGVSNKIILKNLHTLKCSGIPFIIRVPLIPGVSDISENITKIAGLITGATGLIQVELLPYHLTAGAKYAMIGEKYEPKFDPNCRIAHNNKIFEHFNIRSVVL